jgi:uncharacterized protein YdiU (UPF0061 family)
MSSSVPSNLGRTGREYSLSRTSSAPSVAISNTEEPKVVKEKHKGSAVVETQESLEDPQFMEDLCQVLQDMEVEQKKAMERYQLQLQQQKRKSVATNGGDASKLKISIGSLGMI